jgi:hypothetical protein
VTPMRWITFALRGLAGLFVDDGSLALLALAWLAACGLALRYLALDPTWAGLLLFAGLALALLTSALRAGRTHAGP